MTKLTGIITSESKLEGNLGVRNEISVDIIGTGPRGLPGSDGYTPIKGIDYFDGIDGEQGPKGDIGDTGLKGDQGPKGDTGEVTQEEFDELEQDFNQHKLEYVELVTEVGNKANKQQAEWITPTLLNGFTGVIRYRINEFNNLEIIGSLTFTSNISTNTLPAFQLPMSYIPNWFTPGASYKDQRFKFSIPTDDTTAGSARATLSSYNGFFVITNGNNFNQWHINISIPMKV